MEQKEFLKTKNEWLKTNRIVKYNAKAKGAKHINIPSVFEGDVNIYALADTKEADQEEKAIIYFFFEIHSFVDEWSKKDKNGNFKNAPIQSTNGKCFPISFKEFRQHLLKKKSIAFSQKNQLRWCRIEFNKITNPNYLDDFYKYYQILLDQAETIQKKRTKWFVEYQDDLSSISINLWIEKPTSVKTENNYFRALLEDNKITARFYLPDTEKCPFFGAADKQILDRVYDNPNLTQLQRYLSGQFSFNRPNLAWIKGAISPSPTRSQNDCTFNIENLSEEFRKEIHEKLTPILPKKQRNNAIFIAISLAEFCYSRYRQQEAVTKADFEAFFKNNFKWKPRTGSLLCEIQNQLVEIGVIQRAPKKSNPKYNKAVGFWTVGSKLSEEVGLTFTETRKS